MPFRRTALTVPVLSLAVLVGSTATALAAPASPKAAASIENLAAYTPQTTCSATAKPGVVAFERIVLAAYPGTGNSGIVRSCSVGGRSEHKEGRAWDWTVSYTNAKQRAQAQDLINWLFAPDAYKHRYTNARRLGVMYVIWNHRIWGSYNATAGWRAYTGSDPHTGHMHISFSWAGANKKTSYWTGVPAATETAKPAPKPQPSAGTSPVRTAPPKPVFDPTKPGWRPGDDESGDLNSDSDRRRRRPEHHDGRHDGHRPRYTGPVYFPLPGTRR